VKYYAHTAEGENGKPLPESSGQWQPLATHLPNGVSNPQRLSGPNCRPPRKNAGLQAAASFYQNGVTWTQLENAQFPSPMTDANGTFHKPPNWA
jgi:hypothetical protein